ncbi:hypothetical protein PanWU01x14_319140, partial [Parasponia andersonii]
MFSCLLDFGASHHITGDLTNLSLHSDYHDPDDIYIGDGKGMKITHTSSLLLPSSSKLFSLSNALCVPEVKRNLLSVSQLCSSNNISVKFLPNSFVVKDLRTRDILLYG